MNQNEGKDQILKKDEAQKALFQREQTYLKKVLSYIDQRRLYLESNTRKRVEESHELKENAWEEHVELSAVGSNGQMDSAFVQDELGRNEKAIQEQEKERKLLTKLRKSPYFGHITFRYLSDEEEEPGEYYIGLKDIIDTERFTHYVIDWRSPLATVYYNVTELGPVTFLNREKRISGELLAKYQVMVHDSQLIRVLNTEDQVVDEILQMVLGSMSSAKMKAIAHTLQKEQNQIIRTELNRTLIIQGVAGSGKTSIALHRAAYMMYLDPKMKADNILLVSPSESFSAYISAVLPNLGEENVPSLTISQILRQEIAEVEERYLDYNFLAATPDRWSLMSQFDWVYWVDEFVSFLSDNVFVPHDIELKYLKVPSQLLHQLYHINYKYLPPFRRKEAILKHLGDLIYNPQDYQQAVEPLQQELNSMYLVSDLRRAYDVFARWAVEEKHVEPEVFTAGNLYETDLDLLALLKVSLYGPSDSSWVRHLIVDEMQDLSVMAHEVLRRVYPCPRTLLGDVNQAIRFPLGDNYLQRLQNLYKRDAMKTEFHELRVSYRSTLEITEFAREILQDQSILPLERHGEPVEVKRFAVSATDDEFTYIYRKLLSWRESGFRTAAVICKTTEEAQDLRDRLSAHMEQDSFNESLILTDYLKEEHAFSVTICDVITAKGIEFDAVIVRNCSAQNYSGGVDRVALYVAATRPLHELCLTVLGEASLFLPMSEDEPLEDQMNENQALADQVAAEQVHEGQAADRAEEGSSDDAESLD